MAAKMPPNFLYIVATVGLILVSVRVAHMFRGRAMRAFAARWGFRYIGPPAPPKWWWNPAHFESGAPLPGWLPHFRPSGQPIRQAWNVIEGEQNGVPILILDTVIGEYRGGHPCTLIACQTEQNPFGIATPADRVVQSHGWTVLHGVWFLWFSWIMSTKRINGHMNGVRASQGAKSNKAVLGA
jgi:hypothetical protein